MYWKYTFSTYVSSHNYSASLFLIHFCLASSNLLSAFFFIYCSKFLFHQSYCHFYLHLCWLYFLFIFRYFTPNLSPILFLPLLAWFLLSNTFQQSVSPLVSIVVQYCILHLGKTSVTTKRRTSFSIHLCYIFHTGQKLKLTHTDVSLLKASHNAVIYHYHKTSTFFWSDVYKLTASNCEIRPLLPSYLG